ncbi:MAG: hypothetical protein HQL21_03620 [Candidatus Omnitrophica bacterium]|nr:hypothetical protein [Candidatus Omnitrophota bacterium]
MAAYEDQDKKIDNFLSYRAKEFGFAGSQALKWRERALVEHARSALRDYIHKIDMIERDGREDDYRNN